MKLSDFVDINPRTPLPKGTIAEFVPMEALNPSSRYVQSYPKKEYAGGAKFLSGDTLFARITPCLQNGKISQFISNTDFPAFGSTEYWVFRAKEGVSDPSFVYYLSLSDLIRKPAEKSMIGASGRQRAQIEAVQNLDIGNFSLTMQQKISGILGAYDDLIENNSKRIGNLESMARLLYRHSVQDIKTTTSLGAKLTPKKGRNITKSTIKNGNVPVVAGGLTPAYYHDSPNTNSPVITVSASGANAGFVNMYHQDIWASDCSFIDKNVTPFVYYYFTLMKERQSAITHMQRGSAQPHVYPADLEKLEIPDLSDDKVAEVSEQLNPIYQQVGNLTLRNEKLARARDILLPRLMSGEIEI